MPDPATAPGRPVASRGHRNLEGDCIMNDEYYRRVEGLVDAARLRTQRVAVCGVGSGGGFIAEELARLGFHLLLLDFEAERLEPHNIIRHLLGADHLGETKHRAVAEHLRRTCPMATVSSVGIDVVQEHDRLLTVFREFRPDLIVAATDNEGSKFALDQIARVLGIPVIGGGVYNGGVGGEVYLSEPHSACYGCIFEKLQPGNAHRHAPVSVDYTNPGQPQLSASSALRLDILQIAALTVRMVLRRLLAAEGEEAFGMPANANVVIFANRRMPGVFERGLTPRWYRVVSARGCLICGDTAAAGQPGTAPGLEG